MYTKKLTRTNFLKANSNDKYYIKYTNTTDPNFLLNKLPEIIV